MAAVSIVGQENSSAFFQSRDVDRALLSCPVWPLEDVKLDYLFSDNMIFVNSSKTV